ncbi:MAG: FAD-dependent monooxygenase [Hyphomicrobium sp.]|uniref:FAD-dependent monooxygenase n=1 Tax=Hyphomicrobium sp. TaxID=82 RepID=UPI003D11A96F
MGETSTTAAVIGAGPAGLAAALGAGKAGADVVLAAPPQGVASRTPDLRTAALFAGSIALLKNLGAWSQIAPHSAPILAIRIIDDTGALLRAPEVVFTAGEAGYEAFGWNIPNAVLVSALMAAAGAPGSRVRVLETAGITGLSLGGDLARLTTQEGESFQARLVAGADGRNSISRSAAGIATRTWQYPQAALVTTFAHTRPHRSISTEFHRPAGPLTTVPLPGDRSSLVWVEAPDVAKGLATLDDTAFGNALEERLQGLLGGVGEITPRAVFPLSGLTAEAFGRNRVALVGEAGHVIPPIGAQGLNLGLRDAATLAECVALALARGLDPGGAGTLDDYNRRRRPDVTSRIATVDVLNRSLLSSLLPVHLARGFGLVALKTFAPLRRIAIREGLGPSGDRSPDDVPALLLADGVRLLSERAAAKSHSSAA